MLHQTSFGAQTHVLLLLQAVFTIITQRKTKDILLFIHIRNSIGTADKGWCAPCIVIVKLYAASSQSDDWSEG